MPAYLLVVKHDVLVHHIHGESRRLRRQAEPELFVPCRLEALADLTQYSTIWTQMPCALADRIGPRAAAAAAACVDVRSALLITGLRHTTLIHGVDAQNGTGTNTHWGGPHPIHVVQNV